MALEYSAPRGIYGVSRGDNAAALRALPVDPPPPVRAALDGATDASWVSRGAMLLKADAFTLAYDAFRRALVLNSRNPTALSGLSDAAAGVAKAAPIPALAGNSSACRRFRRLRLSVDIVGLRT